MRIPQACTPVILDDIVSTGATMVEALRLLRPLGSRQPVALGVHGLLSDGAGPILEAGGRLVTTNTVPNPMADIDISGLIAAGIADLAA